MFLGVIYFTDIGKHVNLEVTDTDTYIRIGPRAQLKGVKVLPAVKYEDTFHGFGGTDLLPRIAPGDYFLIQNETDGGIKYTNYQVERIVDYQGDIDGNILSLILGVIKENHEPVGIQKDDYMDGAFVITDPFPIRTLGVHGNFLWIQITGDIPTLIKNRTLYDMQLLHRFLKVSYLGKIYHLCRNPETGYVKGFMGGITVHEEGTGTKLARNWMILFLSTDKVYDADALEDLTKSIQNAIAGSGGSI